MPLQAANSGGRAEQEPLEFVGVLDGLVRGDGQRCRWRCLSRQRQGLRRSSAILNGFCAESLHQKKRESADGLWLSQAVCVLNTREPRREVDEMPLAPRAKYPLHY